MGWFGTLFLAGPGSAAGQAVDVDRHLADLRSANMETRIEALRELGTSLDPRLPEALIPLLADEGNSTRRLAARAVGSRWWQIPQERVPAFEAALKRNEASELDDEKNMVARGLGLLRRDYAGNMFARSADGRWVIYERLGHPCLIDTKSGTEELLGWNSEGGLGVILCSIGNSPVEDSVLWHPKAEQAGINFFQGRKESSVGYWEHGKGLTELKRKEILGALKLTEESVFDAGGFYTELVRWDGADLVVRVYYVVRVEGSEEFPAYRAELAWKVGKGTVKVLSRVKE